MNRRRLLAALPLGASVVVLMLLWPGVALADDENNNQDDSDGGDDDNGDDDNGDDDNGDDDNGDDDNGGDEDGDDHVEALKSVQSGAALSLDELLVLAAPYIDGDIINVRLLKRRSRLIYELTVLGRTGKVSKIYFFADTGNLIDR
jgi:uncharacterized membrane protein YkoI